MSGKQGNDESSNRPPSSQNADKGTCLSQRGADRSLVAVDVSSDRPQTIAATHRGGLESEPASQPSSPVFGVSISQRDENQPTTSKGFQENPPLISMSAIAFVKKITKSDIKQSRDQNGGKTARMRRRPTSPLCSHNVTAVAPSTSADSDEYQQPLTPTVLSPKKALISDQRQSKSPGKIAVKYARRVSLDITRRPSPTAASNQLPPYFATSTGNEATPARTSPPCYGTECRSDNARGALQPNPAISSLVTYENTVSGENLPHDLSAEKCKPNRCRRPLFNRITSHECSTRLESCPAVPSLGSVPESRPPLPQSSTGFWDEATPSTSRSPNRLRISTDGNEDSDLEERFPSVASCLSDSDEPNQSRDRNGGKVKYKRKRRPSYQMPKQSPTASLLQAIQAFWNEDQSDSEFGEPQTPQNPPFALNPEMPESSPSPTLLDMHQAFTGFQIAATPDQSTPPFMIDGSDSEPERCPTPPPPSCDLNPERCPTPSPLAINQPFTTRLFSAETPQQITPPFPLDLRVSPPERCPTPPPFDLTETFEPLLPLSNHRQSPESSSSASLAGLWGEVMTNQSQRPTSLFASIQTNSRGSNGQEGEERIESDDSDEDRQRVGEIVDELRRPLPEIGFRKAFQLLHELRVLRRMDDFDSLLLVTECELHLSRGKHLDVIKDMTKLLQKFKTPTLDVILGSSQNFLRAGRPVLALILRFVWCDNYVTANLSRDGVVEWLADQVMDIAIMSIPLIDAGGRYRGIAIEFALRKAEVMLKDLRMRKDLDPHRALLEGNCTLKLFHAYHATKLFYKALVIGLEGISALSVALNNEAAEYCVYAMILNCVGLAHRSIGRQHQAELYFLQARMACRLAKDFSDEEQRRCEERKAVIGAFKARGDLE